MRIHHARPSRRLLLLLLLLLAAPAALLASAASAGEAQPSRRGLPLSAVGTVEADAATFHAGPDHPRLQQQRQQEEEEREGETHGRRLRGKAMRQHELVNEFMSSIFLALAIAAVGGLACCIVRCDAARVCPCLCGDTQRALEELESGGEDIEESPALKQEAAPALDASDGGGQGVSLSLLGRSGGGIGGGKGNGKGEEDDGAAPSTGQTAATAAASEEEEGASPAEAGAAAAPFSLSASATSLLGLLGLSSKTVGEESGGSGGDGADKIEEGTSSSSSSTATATATKGEEILKTAARLAQEQVAAAGGVQSKQQPATAATM